MDQTLEKRRFLVATPNIVVGQDLKEALMTSSEAEVDLVVNLDQAAERPYEIAVFGLPLDAVLSDPRVRALHKSGTQIVVLNGHFSHDALNGTGVIALSQPFSTEDVEALLKEISRTAKGTV
ncbi:MAG: hypothetical protein ACU0GG_12270 [Paracoccaceae bacterium]